MPEDVIGEWVNVTDVPGRGRPTVRVTLGTKPHAEPKGVMLAVWAEATLARVKTSGRNRDMRAGRTRTSRW